jgi:CRISPR/Cas system endoribonuclease Cas6 (RAMP superfamily)
LLPIFKKLNDDDIKILVKFLQRFQVTLENQLSIDKFKSFSNLHIGSLDKDIFEKFFNSLESERFVKQINENNNVSYFICYEILDEKFKKCEAETLKSVKLKLSFL